MGLRCLSGVVNPDQIQALWRSGGASLIPITGSQNRTQPFWRMAMQPYLHQAANHNPHLMMQEGSGSYPKLHLPRLQIAVCRHHLHPFHAAHWGFGLALCVPKAAKILLPLQQLGRLLHRQQIQRLPKMPDPPAMQGADGGMGVNAVAIAPPNRRKTGMKIIGNGLNVAHTDPMRINKVV